MFGLDADTLEKIRGALEKVPPVQKALIYGSRAKGNYKAGSDIDMTLVGERLTVENSVHPLMDQIDDLYLPYMFDISIFKNLDDRDLVDHILRVGKVLYQREGGGG